MTSIEAGQRAADRQIRGFWSQLLRQPGVNILVVFVGLQILCVGYALVAPDNFPYLSSTNIGLILKAVPVLGIMALGVGLLMVAGEFDLSVGSVFGLTSYSMAELISAGWPLWLALAATLLLGLAIGFVNGMVTVKFDIPSFVTTLGSMLVVRGMIRWISEGASQSFVTGEVFEKLLTGSVLGVQAQFIWFVGFAVAAGLILHRSKLGNHFYLVGGDVIAAIAVGVNVHRVKVIAFMLSALGATLSGIISATRIGTTSASQGLGFELRVIAICVIGGIFLRGGRGGILGIFVGTVFLFTIEDVLLLLRFPGFFLDTFVGAVIVIAVIMNTWVSRRRLARRPAR